MDEYTAWLEDALGAQVRYHLQLEPHVATSYVAAGLVGTADAAPDAGAAEPELADLPFADVADDDLAEAVTGIAPPGTDPAVATEVNDLATYMTDDEKAAFADLTPEQVAEALAQAKDELAAEEDATPTEAGGGAAGPEAGGDTEPELADLPFADVADDDLAEAVTGIAPPGTDPAVATEVNDLATYMTDDEKAAFADLTPEQVAEALAQAKDELAAEAVS